MQMFNKKRFIRFSAFDVFVTLMLIVVLVAMIYPVLYVISISFSSTKYILANEITFYPRGFNLQAYGMILKTPKIPRAYMNSITYTAVGVLFSIFFTITTAYSLSKKSLIFRKQFMLLIIITMFFGGGMIPTYLLVKQLGLLDSMWSLVIPNLVWTFDLIVLKSFFESLPDELYEAAVIDGASEFRILSTIYVPLSKAALASIGLFYIMGNWNSYLIPSIYINSIEKYPLQVVLREMLIQDTAKASSDIMEYAKMTPQALKNATIFITILPIMIIYPFLQKYFAKGMMIGSIKE